LRQKDICPNKVPSGKIKRAKGANEKGDKQGAKRYQKGKEERRVRYWMNL